MTLQLYGQVEAFTTLYAIIRHPGINTVFADVCLERCYLDEAFAALWTQVGLVRRVGEGVALQAAQLAEALPTVRTEVGLVPRVSVDVVHQMEPLPEALGTVLTHIGLLLTRCRLADSSLIVGMIDDVGF